MTTSIVAISRIVPSAAIGLLILGTLPFGPAHGQTTPPKGSVELVDQTTWVTGGQPFGLRARVATNLSPDEVDFVVTVYGAVTNRSQFQQSLTDRTSGSSVILERRSLAEVMQPDGIARVVLPVQDPAQRRFYLKENGVYPVRIDIRTTDTGSVLGHFTTHLINQVSTAPVANRLGVAVVLPVAAPLPEPGKTLTLPDNGDSVASVTGSVARHPSVPATLAAQPETLERLANATKPPESPQLLRDLQNLSGTHDVTGATWAPVGTSLYSSENRSELTAQFARGEAILSSTFGQFDRTTWIANQPLDSTAMNELRSRGYERTVARENDLVPLQRDTTLLRPFGIPVGKTRQVPGPRGAVSSLPYPTIQADAGLAEHFLGGSPPVLRAHQLLADLAVLYNDRPGQARTAVIMPDLRWRPDAGFLDVLLNGLTTGPLTVPLTLDKAFETPAEGTGKASLSRQFKSAPKNSVANLPTDRLQDSRKRINGFSNLVATNNEVLSELERNLLIAERGDLSPRQRTGYLDAVKKIVDDELGEINIPADRSLRLTARQGEIPVSIQNETGYPIRVKVRLASDKLLFPQGDNELLTVERQHVTKRFAVETKTSGAFPVEVFVTSPDGNLLLERSRVTVRSTAASGVGVGLSIGAIVFLLLWWLRSVVKHRRRPRLNTP